MRRGDRGASRPGSGNCSGDRKRHFWQLELALTVSGVQWPCHLASRPTRRWWQQEPWSPPRSPAPRARGSLPPSPQIPEGGRAPEALLPAATQGPTLQPPRPDDKRQGHSRSRRPGPSPAGLTTVSPVVTWPHPPAREDATGAGDKTTRTTRSGARAGARPAHTSPPSPPRAHTSGRPVPLSSRRDVCKASAARLPSAALGQRGHAACAVLHGGRQGLCTQTRRCPHKGNTSTLPAPRSSHLRNENNSYSCSPRAE